MSPKIFLPLFVIPFLSGCVTVGNTFPGGRLESPETIGKKEKIKLGLVYSQGENVTIASDASYRPLSISNPLTASSQGNLFANFGAALFDHLDFIGKTDLIADTTLGFKFQVWGENYSDAKAGNFSLSVTGSLGATPFAQGQGDQSGVFGPGGFGWHWKSNDNSIDGSVIAGYRIIDNLMLYGGTSYTKNWYSGLIHQDGSTDGTSGANDYPFSVNNTQGGYNLGVEWRLGVRAILMAEIFYCNYQMTNISNVSNLTGYALSFGTAL